MCGHVGKGCGEGNGEDVGKCVEVWGPNTLLIPHISLPSPFPTSPLTSPHPITLSYTSSHIPPSKLQHIFLLSGQMAEWYGASASGSVDLGFDSESGQTNDFNIGIHSFPA